MSETEREKNLANPTKKRKNIKSEAFFVEKKYFWIITIIYYEASYFVRVTNLCTCMYYYYSLYLMIDLWARTHIVEIWVYIYNTHNACTTIKRDHVHVHNVHTRSATIYFLARYFNSILVCLRCAVQPSHALKQRHQQYQRRRQQSSWTEKISFISLFDAYIQNRQLCHYIICYYYFYLSLSLLSFKSLFIYDYGPWLKFISISENLCCRYIIWIFYIYI